MSVHMFRCLIGRGPMSVSDLDTRISDWVGSNAEWVGDSAGHELRERNTRVDGSGETYYGIDVRFHIEDSKANLLQKFEDKLKDKVSWYRVGYHECTHDADDPIPCQCSDKEQWTGAGETIPSGVPDFEVS